MSHRDIALICTPIDQFSVIFETNEPGSTTCPSPTPSFYVPSNERTPANKGREHGRPNRDKVAILTARTELQAIIILIARVIKTGECSSWVHLQFGLA